jgi:hypothetical protein
VDAAVEAAQESDDKRTKFYCVMQRGMCSQYVFFVCVYVGHGTISDIRIETATRELKGDVVDDIEFFVCMETIIFSNTNASILTAV